MRSANSENPHAWDIAVLDRLLASQPPEVTRLRAGDMILPRSFVKAARDILAANGAQTEAAFDGGVVLWPGGVIPYVFDGNVTALHEKMFLDGAAEWASVANLTFVPRTNQTDYVHVQEGMNGDNSSAVGKLGGAQDLTVSAWVRSVITHELGHTIGLVHEHQRSDRDNFVTILQQNIQSGLEFAFALLPNSNNRGAYDFLSVMHYVRNAFATDSSLDTIEPKTGYTQYIDIMGQSLGRELSTLDRQGVASIYGAGPTLSSVVTNTKDSGVGSLRAAIFYAFDHANTTITFNIPTNDSGHTGNIYLLQPTDTMLTPAPGTIIDGTTQPNGNQNGPSIVLDGGMGPQPQYLEPAFYLNGANVTLRGLAIRNSPASGIQLDGPNSAGNVIKGCWLGLDASGTSAAPNTYAQISLTNGANGNTIGGLTSSSRNVISGGNAEGIYISDPTTTGNTVLGNYIGLDSTGTVALGNRYSGVNITNGAHDNVVGGTGSGARNFICANGFDGVSVNGTATNNNIVQGNTVGLNVFGNPVPNVFREVTMADTASGNLVGGAATGAANIISGNADEGIVVFGDATHNTFQRNLVFNNHFVGIRLWTFDPGTPNDLQAAPTLNSATLGINNSTLNGATTCNGSLTSSANTTFRIELFANAGADPSGSVEGQFFVGDANVTTNGAGTADFSFQVQTAIPVGYAISATATNPAGSTSEFSQDVNVATAGDSNGDGIPDAWATAHGFSVNASIANQDTDGDGLTNLQEFYAGLDPRSAQSFLRLTSVVKQGSGVQLSFPSASGRVYRLEGRGGLTSGSWQSLLDGIVGTGSAIQLSDAPGVTQRFYRVRVIPP
ncbi:MAG: M12 family metallopeptidase [Chthoniobacterales bacterium]